MLSAAPQPVNLCAGPLRNVAVSAAIEVGLLRSFDAGSRAEPNFFPLRK